VSHNTCVSVDDDDLPPVKSVRDLGVIVSHDWLPTLHATNIVGKAHKRSAAIYRAFTSRNVDLLVRAYVTYVRPIVEHDSLACSPYTVKYIDNIESEQRRFTKRLPAVGALTYAERLRHLDIPGLELRRLHADLLYCCKVVFGYTDLQASDFFEMAPVSNTMGTYTSCIRSEVLL